MKKCPYCFTELDDRASICSGCKKKVGKNGRNGIAKKYTSPVTKLLLFILILGFLPSLPIIFGSLFNPGGYNQQDNGKDIAFQKAWELALKNKNIRIFTESEKKKIFNHTTIADDISVELGRGLDEGRKLLIKNFSITMEQLIQINVEGIRKVWNVLPKSAKNGPEYKYLYGEGKKLSTYKEVGQNNVINNPALSSCYQLGYRLGRCTGKLLKGMDCDPENEFDMPSRCKNKPDTKKGITAGLKSVD